MSGQSIERWLCFAVDVQRYATDHVANQVAVQRDLLKLLDGAAEAAGLHRSIWVREARGDQEMAMIPAAESELAVLDGLVNHLATLLYEHNRDRLPGRRLRLRTALDHGVGEQAANGFAGTLPIRVGRLLDSTAARAAPDAGLVLILSDRLHRDLVQAGRTSVPPECFREVAVDNKEFRERAWLRVPDVADVHALDLPATVLPAESAGDLPREADRRAKKNRLPAPTVSHIRDSQIAIGNGNVVTRGFTFFR